MKHLLRAVAGSSQPQAAFKKARDRVPLCLAAVLTLLFAVNAGAQQWVYVITNDGANFTAKVNNNHVTTGALIRDVLDTIRARSYGNPITIQFGAGAGDTLNLGRADMFGISFSTRSAVGPQWGEITLTGTVKSDGDASATVYVIDNGDADVSRLVVNSTANIINTYKYGEALHFDGYSNGENSRTRLTVSGGELSGGTHAYGGTIMTYGGYLKITGGVIKGSDSSVCVYSPFGGNIDITGGKILGAIGKNAVDVSYGTLSISGDAEIIGNTAGVGAASVYAGGGGILEISGGTITNLVGSGNAVFLNGTTAELTLSGNTPPKITGAIVLNAPERIIAKSFNPGTAEYTLAPRASARVDSAVVVVGAGAYLSKFKYANANYELFKQGEDIAIKLKASVTVKSYVVTEVTNAGVFGGFRIAKNGSQWRNGVQDFLAEIRVDANGGPCNIQLGDGTKALVGDGHIWLNIDQLHGDGWGRVTLSGKLIAEPPLNPPYKQIYGALSVYNGASVSSSLDITTVDYYFPDVYVIGGSDYTHTGGTLLSDSYNGSLYATDAFVTVTGGNVHSINAGWKASIAVSGGTVGKTSFAGNAIKIYGECDVVISGTANVVSADTSQFDGGTICNNGGTLTISGGTVSNLAPTGGRAVYNNIYAGATVGSVVAITGGEVRARNARNDTLGGVVFNNGAGVMRISGGKVINDESDGYVVQNRLGNLTISGTAEIYSGATSSNARAVYCYGGYAGDSTAGVLNITGGTIRAESGVAVYSGVGAKTTISGTADISSGHSSYAVYVGGAGPSAYMSVLGGTITHNIEDSVKTAIFCGTAYSAGYLTLGGSPTLNGSIRMGNSYQNNIVSPTEITILTTGENAFAPGGNVYKLVMLVFEKEEGRVMLKNGAAFTPNFALDTTIVNVGTKFRLAANGNNAVATQYKTYEVSFNLNGGSGTAPKSFHVMEGGTIGEAVKPSTRPYLSPSVAGLCPQGKCASDGEWYISSEESAGEVFLFRTESAPGRPVLADLTLTLKWTDKVSVLEVSREVPGAPQQGAAVIAPVAMPAGEFTVGPNPVAKHAGAVSFFWSGAAVKGGKLFVYDASGNLVKKISVSGAGTGAAASWDLTDAKGRPAASGTYAAKGVIKTNSGKSEKVSVLLGVR